MIRVSKAATVCVFAVALAGCADGGKSPYASLGEDFAKANKSAADVFGAQIAEAKRVRRLSIASTYVGIKTVEAEYKYAIIPITRQMSAAEAGETLNQNFANFVCAGVGEGNGVASALRYTGDYAKSLEDITKQPEDSFSGYADALKKLRQDKPLIPPVKSEQADFDNCYNETIARLGSLDGKRDKEGIAALFAAGQAAAALYDSLKTFGKGLMRLATVAEQRAALRRFVNKNRENFDKAFEKLEKDGELQKLHDARLRMALVVPHLSFQRMMSLDRDNKKLEVIDAALKTHALLAEYDALRTVPPPQNVARFFAEIRTKLDDIADDKYDLDDLIGFIKFAVGEIETVKAQYKDVQDKAEKAQAALAALR